MSTASKSRSSKPRKLDPFQYGWRYVDIVSSDRTVVNEQVPLTLRDVLFPELGDFIAQSSGHDSDVGYLKDVFGSRLSAQRTAVVISNCRVDWNLPGVKPLGPDVAVFLGVKQFIDWATFDVAAERAKPLVVVEVTSPKTRKNDVVHKFRYYHRAKVPVYLIADASGAGAKRRLTIAAYTYARPGYQNIVADAKGRIYLEPLGIWVGVTRDLRGGYDRLACYDGKTGKELGDYNAVMVALAAAEERTREAEERAREAEERAREAEARAREAEARAREAEARAREAEARSRALEAGLKRRRT